MANPRRVKFKNREVHRDWGAITHDELAMAIWDRRFMAFVEHAWEPPLKPGKTRELCYGMRNDDYTVKLTIFRPDPDTLIIASVKAGHRT